MFTWGETSYESYVNSLEVIETASAYIEKKISENGSVFGGLKTNSLSEEDRKSQAAKLAPILRGMCSSENNMIGHFTDDDVVLEFINSNDLDRLAPMGTSCPDHFLRTKIKPLLLDLSADENLEDVESLISKLVSFF